MRLTTGNEVVLVISDLHIPFQHPDALDFLTCVKEEFEPTRTVSIGDSYDMHALSRFIHDPDGFSAGHEHIKALEIFHKLYDIFPEVVEVESTHNQRLLRRAYNNGIPRGMLKDYRDMMEAPPGWQYVENIIIDNIMYEHGNAFTGQYGARTAAIANRMSTVIGHFHSQGAIYYLANRDNMIFGACVGCLIDTDAYAFEYARTWAQKPTIMCAVVDRGIPTLIPMVMDEDGRWIGEL